MGLTQTAAIPLTLVSFILTLGGRHTSGQNVCLPRLPTDEEELYKFSLWQYQPSTASLEVNLNAALRPKEQNGSLSSNCSSSSSGQELHTYITVDLIATTRLNINVCRKLKDHSLIQASRRIDVTTEGQLQPAMFTYVQGLYYIRFHECSGSNCGRKKQYVCLGDPSNRKHPISFTAQLPKNDKVCESDFPSNMSVEMVNTFVNRSGQESFCDVRFRGGVPLCSAYQSYHTAVMTLVRIPDQNQLCSFADYKASVASTNSTDIFPLVSCSELQSHSDPNDSYAGCRMGGEAFISYLLEGLERNASYCVFFRLNDPHCRGPFGCTFYTEAVNCELMERLRMGPRRGYLQQLMTEPMFIGMVSLILVLSLALLTWTVIQCSKKKSSTSLMAQTNTGQIKKLPPRSLTEDDLEHISRLPSQEIVLVYFPDTSRFKDLNRKLRNWLITLDVNDVKDIYDEKATDVVLKNPDQWVKDTLAGPEKRVILVCSRLAYECLSAVQRGVSSPRFVDSDPHFGLLTKTIQYLDREMRGNYRNLICVRYEDLKICSRQYSSEAFNLVPGTEYVLPQHLEDIYRWIHPRNPRLECWSEGKPEVRELLDAIRQYRNHDENIFTVQFATSNIYTCDSG